MPTKPAALLGFLAAGILATVLTAAESAPRKLVVQLDWMAEPEHGGFYQAQARGFFREEGLDVTLIDTEPNPGGVCLYRGCIPSKALLHVANVVNEAREASELGVTFADPSIDVDKVRIWKDDVVSKLTGGLGQLSRARKVKYVRGRGRFSGPNSIRVSNDGELSEVNLDRNSTRLNSSHT